MLFLATFFPTWEGGAGAYDFVGVSVVVAKQTRVLKVGILHTARCSRDWCIYKTKIQRAVIFFFPWWIFLCTWSFFTVNLVEFGDSMGAGAISVTEISIFLWGEPMPEKISILAM